MKPLLIALSFFTAVPAFAQHMNEASSARQEEVAERGPDVMPFSLAATTHIFTKTKQGGIQRVVAKNTADAVQIKLVREHLQDIKAQFSKDDFSGPSHIHGDSMAGLAELKMAKPNQLSLTYRDVKGGAELKYRAADPRLIRALHKWFDAQLSDHGADAISGHHHHQH